jgi:hypothetical protein
LVCFASTIRFFFVAPASWTKPSATFDDEKKTSNNQKTKPMAQFEDELFDLTEYERKQECENDYFDSKPIPPELAVRFRINRTLKCYNALNLVRWIMTGLYPVNGKRVRNYQTVKRQKRIPFSTPQLRRLYTLVRNILEPQRDKLNNEDLTLLDRINRELAGAEEKQDEEDEERDDDEAEAETEENKDIPRVVGRHVRHNILQSLEMDCGLVVDVSRFFFNLEEVFWLWYGPRPDETPTHRVQIAFRRGLFLFKENRRQEVQTGLTPMFQLAMRSARNLELSSPYESVRGPNEPRKAFQFVDWWIVYCFVSYLETLDGVSDTFENPETDELNLSCEFDDEEFMNWVYVQSRFFQRCEEKDPDQRMALWRNRVREVCPAGVFYENRIMQPFNLLRGPNELRPTVYVPPDDAFEHYSQPADVNRVSYDFGAMQMDVDSDVDS